MHTTDPNTRRFSSFLLAAACLLGCSDDGPEADVPNAVEGTPADGSDVANDPTDVEPGVVIPEDACAHYAPERQVFFGDLHVHTSLSLDANLQGTRLNPADAYALARGSSLDIQPYDEDDNGLRTVQLARPLDFVAVADHAEFLGLVVACEDPESTPYETAQCRQFRDNPAGAFVPLNALTAALQNNVRWPAACGDEGQDCDDAAGTAWQIIRDAAEEADDSTDACEFTAFVGYEWSGGPAAENLHRNVIFRGTEVPDRAISYFDEPYPEGLWASLRAECIDADTGCDVLAIPHNSNLSNGRMFNPLDADRNPMTAEAAALRIELEPLIEVFQHKGDSECWPGSPVADELCGFEKMPYNSLATANLDLNVEVNPNDFIRDALGVGMQLAESLGVNPFEYGFIGSSDTHIAAPGLVAEAAFPGHGGAGQGNRDELPVGLPDSVAFNPGGLAVVWAEENSRGSIFDALRRRETYGTSGPRLTVRFFGGWDYPEALCDDPNLVAVGYRDGVPMGGTLSAPASDEAPVFLLSALADPGATNGSIGEPSTPLQRIQIVKGWLEGGEYRVEVYDVGGDSTAGTEPGVDLNTCEPMDEGFASLCSVWTDPDFDASQRATYYARVIEIPTCRWTTHQCVAAGVDCDDRDTVTPDWGSCCDDRFETTIQERAWTSPIWYTP
ncbi:MAG: hypothetical protein ACJAYU_000913 [Bradymonadia bacterium]|jgi:hypothetical protein